MKISFFLTFITVIIWAYFFSMVCATPTSQLSENKDLDLPLNLIKTQFLEELNAKKNEIINEIKQDENYYYVLPPDCKEVQRRGYKASGVYRIKPSSKEFWVWCDLATQGGGWIYVANRFDGSQNFVRYWNEYKNGFGNLSGEFWVGLDHLYDLTNSKSNELLFELVDWELKKVYAKYDQFLIGNEEESFVIKTVGKYSGNAGDTFSYHNGMNFSTLDRYQQNTCVEFYRGGWWFHNCYHCFITGKYITRSLPSNDFDKGIIWNSFHSSSLKQARMMIRPSDV